MHIIFLKVSFESSHLIFKMKRRIASRLTLSFWQVKVLERKQFCSCRYRSSKVLNAKQEAEIVLVGKNISVKLLWQILAIKDMNRKKKLQKSSHESTSVTEKVAWKYKLNEAELHYIFVNISLFAKRTENFSKEALKISVNFGSDFTLKVAQTWQ